MSFHSYLLFQVSTRLKVPVTWFYHHQKPSHHPTPSSLLLTLPFILRAAPGTLSYHLLNNHLYCGQFMHQRTWVIILTSSLCGRPGRRVWQLRELVVHHHCGSLMSDGGVARVAGLSGDLMVIVMWVFSGCIREKLNTEGVTTGSKDMGQFFLLYFPHQCIQSCWTHNQWSYWPFWRYTRTPDCESASQVTSGEEKANNWCSWLTSTLTLSQSVHTLYYNVWCVLYSVFSHLLPSSVMWWPSQRGVSVNSHCHGSQGPLLEVSQSRWLGGMRSLSHATQ
jgi:hypothetical protein